MFISPLLGLITAIKQSNLRVKRWALTIFTTFYGSLIMLNPGSDGSRHWDRVYDSYTDLNFNEFLSGLWYILKFDPQYWTNDDVYIHVLSYFTGSVIGFPELFFVFVSFVYGYFFAGVFIKVLNFQNVKNKRSLSYLFLIFAAIFILWKNLEGMNTVRTWTGLWILMYGAIYYFETGKKKYLFLMLIPPFIHIGYFMMAIPAWIVAFFGSKPRIVYSVVFLSSFFVAIGQAEFFPYLADIPIGEKKYHAYLVEEENGTEFQMGEGVWYNELRKTGIHFWGIHLLAGLLLLQFLWSKSTMNLLETKLYSIALLSFSLANYFSFLSALNNRSNIIGGTFLLAVVVLLLKRNELINPKNKFKKINYIVFIICIFLILPYTIALLSHLFYYSSFFLIAFPFIPWIFLEDNISIREFINIVLDFIR